MQIVLSLTKACNYSCPFCFAKASKASSPRFNRFDFLEQLSCLDDLNVTLSGGEPTLIRNINEVINGLLDYAKSVSILTNGSNPQLLSELKVDSIQVSLDGTPELHNQLRGSEDAFENCIKTINNIIKMKRRVSVQMTVIPENLGMVRSVVEILRKYPIESLRINAAVPPAQILTCKQLSMLLDMLITASFEMPLPFAVTTNVCTAEQAIRYYRSLIDGFSAPWFIDLDDMKCAYAYPESPAKMQQLSSFLRPELRTACAREVVNCAVDKLIMLDSETLVQTDYPISLV